MVLQKIGMDAEHADQLIQLVAIVNYRPPHTTSNSVQFDGVREAMIVLRHDQSPLSVYNQHPKHSVWFCLQWRRTDDMVINSRHSTESKPYVAASSILALRSNAAGSTLPGAHKTMTSQASSLSWQRRCDAAQPPSDCLIHYEPCAPPHNYPRSHPASVQNPTRGLRRPCSPQSPRGISIVGNGHRRVGDTSAVRNSCGSGSESGAGGMLLAADRITAICGDLHRPCSNLAAVASSDSIAEQQHFSTGGRRRRSLVGGPFVGGRMRRMRSAASSIGRCFDDDHTTFMSVGSLDHLPLRPTVTFSSLPDISGTGRLRSEWAAGSDANDLHVDLGHRLSSNNAFQSTCVSMPCISDAQHHRHWRQSHRAGRGHGRGHTPKRFLPTLSIPEEAVEAKRKSMSALLIERLHQVSHRRVMHTNNKSSRSSSKSSSNFNKQTNELSTDFSRSRRNNTNNATTAATTTTTPATTKSWPAGPVAIDDDCMSVTSREVAAILSTAGPMAPPSDEDDDYCSGDDDTTQLHHQQQQERGQQQQRVSSALQLLRVSETTSTCSSPADNSTASSPSSASLPRARLNNGRCGRGAGEFRPKLNGVDAATCRTEPEGSGTGGVSVFELLRSHWLLRVTIKAQLSNGHHIRGPPFEVVNDVIYVRRRRCHSNRVKVAVPMVTSSTGKYRKDWLMTSSEHVQRGDIVVEVNGQNVLTHTSVKVHNLLLSYTRLELVVARSHDAAPQIKHNTQHH